MTPSWTLCDGSSARFSTSLYNRTRQEAIRQDKQIADVVCDALAVYLDSKAAAFGSKGVVAESWGILALPARQLRELLVDEVDTVRLFCPTDLEEAEPAK